MTCSCSEGLCVRVLTKRGEVRETTYAYRPEAHHGRYGFTEEEAIQRARAYVRTGPGRFAEVLDPSGCVVAQFMSEACGTCGEAGAWADPPRVPRDHLDS